MTFLFCVLCAMTAVHAEQKDDTKFNAVERFVKAFNDRDIDAMLALASEDITWHYV